MLSKINIERELLKGKHMAIHPLNMDNINGSSINLTASKNAWNVLTKESAYCKDEDEGGREYILIPPRETVSILTQETLWVSNKISGTYHSRVSLSAKGLSNISTTLDPNWVGFSLITITNLTSEEREIDIGTGIVTVTFSYLNKPVKNRFSEIAPNRADIYSRFNLSFEQINLLSNESWHRDPVEVVYRMKKNNEGFDRLVREKWTYKLRQLFSSPMAAIISSTIVGILSIIVTWFVK